MAAKLKQIEYNKDKDIILKQCEDHFVYHLKKDINNDWNFYAEDVDTMKIGDLYDAIRQNDVFFILEEDDK